LTPNYVSRDDGVASNYQSVWVYPKSPTTPYRSPDSSRQQSRYLLLDPRARDSDGRVGQDDWWFVIERSWPADFDPNRHGNWGRQVNFHNVAGDVGWDTGSGVSALALDWLSNAPAPQFTLEYYDGGKPHYLPTPPRDAFQTYVVHFVAGRTDGTTVHPGALTVWANGSDSPVIALSNINTLQRAGGVTQKWMQLWEGDYTQNLPIVARTQFALTRVGKTLAEALADRPVAIGDGSSGQVYTGTGTNLGPPSAREITSRAAGPGSGSTAAPTPSPAPNPAPTPAPRPAPASRVPTLIAAPARGTVASLGLQEYVVEWDGRLFRDVGVFRSYLIGLGVEWSAFLDRHPAVVENAGLLAVLWNGKQFYDQASLRRELRSKGVSYQRWSLNHPHAATILAGLPVQSAQHVLATVRETRPLIRWSGIDFMTATGLRLHLARRGIVWNDFLVGHSAVAQRLGLAAVDWSGMRFYTTSSLERWLLTRGLTLASWAREHPGFAEKLAP